MIKPTNKIGVFTSLFVLAVALAVLTGCRSNNSMDNNSLQTTGPGEINSAADDKTDWKTAYKNYLAFYSPEMEYETLGLVDFNGDEQPELVILDDSHGTLRGRYIILSCQNGEAAEICLYGTSSSITEVNGQFYFYRDFDSIHDSGGMYGYGFVSRLDCRDGIFSIAKLLESSIDHNYASNLDELSWQLRGEENVIKSSDFKNYLTIQQWADDNKWQDIDADEYLSLKNTYIGKNPSGKQIADYFKYKLDFFDSADNTRPITQNELDEYFGQWGK